MEQEFLEKKTRPYAEKKLLELLSFTCEQLYPTDGYSLELDGLHSSTLARKELETNLGVNLSKRSGAKINLAFDSVSGELELKSFRHPLEGQPGAAFIISRTSLPKDSALGYAKYIDIGHNQTDSAHYSLPKLQGINPSHILKSYGVNEAPHPGHETYIPWRAELLSRCENGWLVSEEAELLTAFGEHSTETIKVANRSRYGKNGQVETIKSVSRKFSVQDTTTAEDYLDFISQDLETSVIEISDARGTELHIINELTSSQPEPFIINGDRKIISHKVEKIDLDEENFYAAGALLEDTAMILRNSR